MDLYTGPYTVTIFVDRSDLGTSGEGLAYRIVRHDSGHEESGACEADSWEDAGREVSAAWLNGADLALSLGQDGAWRARGEA